MATSTRRAEGRASAGASSGPVRVLVGLESTRDRALLRALHTAGAATSGPFLVGARCLVAADLVAAVEAGGAHAALVGEGLYGLEPATLTALTDANLQVVLLGSLGAPEGALPPGVLGLPAEAAPSQVCAVLSAAVRGDAEDLAAALHAAGVQSSAAQQDSAEWNEAPAEARVGEVIVFIGPPHGKTGQTRCSIEVGRVLGEFARTLVVDAVQDEPALVGALGLRPERNLAVVAAAATPTERAHVLREVAQPLDASEPSQAMVLAGVPGAALRARISPGFLSEVLEQVAGPGGYRYVLVDAGAEPPGGTSAGACWRSLVEAADRVLLVVEPDLVGLQRALGTLERLHAHADEGRMAVILSRYQAGAHDAAAEVARLLDGVPVVGVVPLDERGCATALRLQRPLGALGRGPAAVEFRRIADELCSRPGRAQAGWWRRLSAGVGAGLESAWARRPSIGRRRRPLSEQRVPRAANRGGGPVTGRQMPPASARGQVDNPATSRVNWPGELGDGET